MPQSASRPVAVSPRSWRQRAALAVLTVALVLLLGVARWDTHSDIAEVERDRLQSRVSALEDTLARELAAVRAGLRGLRSDLELVDPAQRQVFTMRRLSALTDAVPGVRSMHVIDAQGRLWASSAPQLVGRDFSSRDYLRTAAADPRAERLYLSAPFQTALGVRTVALSVALQRPDGAFDGVVIAALEPDYLRSLIAATLYANDMAGLVVHGGRGAVILQHPEPRGGSAIGDELLMPGSPLPRLLAGADYRQLQSATLPASAGQGASPRLYALRRLQPDALQMDQPLLLALSRDQAALFAPWRNDTAMAGVLLAAALVVSWGALLVLQRRRAEVDALAQETARLQAADRERLRLALHGGDLALWDARLDSGETVVNERWCTMLGYGHADYRNGELAWLTLLHPDDRDRAVAAQQAHIDGQTAIYESVHRLRNREGGWVWVLDRGRVVERAADGQARRFVGTHLDISERMQAEQALRDSQTQLAELAAALPGPVARLDAQGRYRFTNAACDQWFGRTHAQVHGRSWRAFNSPTVQQVVSPELALALQGQTRTVDVTLPTVSGDRDCQLSLVPDRDPTGGVRGCFIVVTDVSPRRQAEEALRRSQDELRMAGRLARVGSWRQDLIGGRATLSDELCAMLQLPPGCELAADQGFDFVAPSSQPALHAQIEGCRQRAEPFDIEVDAMIAGQPQRMRVIGEAVVDERGRVVGMQGAVQDISESHGAAAQLQELQSQRLALERQLREAQKMDSIGTLAGGIAHDFNNILPAILGNAALARADLADLPQARAALHSLDQIKGAALRARSLVQQILTFSRRGPGALQPQPLRPVVEETLALLRATLPANVRIDTQLAEQTLVVEADATQLQQVLMNLCTNAWHALPEAGGRIEVGLQPVDSANWPVPENGGPAPQGPGVRLWVRDDGCGIQPTALPRIFDPFFTTKAVGLGTGLGLSVVHGIVRSHHGTIDVESAPGVGSCFGICLPRVELPAVAPAAGGDLAAAPPGHGEHVLYVDDDAVMTELVPRLLDRAGYRVSAVEDAAQALALVAISPRPGYALVVTDFNMPGMSGLDLARELATLRPEIPVIITSGYLSDRLRSDARAVGVRALLRKENTLEKLPELVRQVLTRAEAGAVD